MFVAGQNAEIIHQSISQSVTQFISGVVAHTKQKRGQTEEIRTVLINPGRIIAILRVTV